MAKRKASYLLNDTPLLKMVRWETPRYFDWLPDEALFCFFSWVPPIEIGTFALTCHRWAKMARHRNLWHTLVSMRWDNIPQEKQKTTVPKQFSPSVPQDKDGIVWREYYMIRDLFESLVNGQFAKLGKILSWNSFGELEGLSDFLKFRFEPLRYGPSIYLFLLEMFLVYAQNDCDELLILLNAFQDAIRPYGNLPLELWRVAVHKSINLLSYAYPKFEKIQKDLIYQILFFANMSIVKKLKTVEDQILMQHLIALLLKILYEQVQNDDFITCDGFSVQEKETPGQVALQCLDSLALANWRIVAPIVYPKAKKLLQSCDVFDLVSGCALIGVTAEGLTTLKSNLNEIFPLILACICHSDERVVKAAFITIGLFCNSWSPEIQEKYHSVLLPEYMKLIDDKRYSSYICSSLSSFFNECGPVFNYINPQSVHLLWPKLLDLVPTEHHAISTFATLSVVASSEIRNFLAPIFEEKLIPSLIQIIPKKTGSEHFSIVECLSCCCPFVGKEKFTPFLEETIKHLLSIDFKGHKNTINTVSCWMRLLEVLEADIVQYLPALMPKLLEVDDDQDTTLRTEIFKLIIQLFGTIPRAIVPWIDGAQILFQAAIEQHDPKALEGYIAILKAKEENQIMFTRENKSFVKHLLNSLAIPGTPNTLEFLELLLSLKMFDPIPEHEYPIITDIIIKWIEFDWQSSTGRANKKKIWGAVRDEIPKFSDDQKTLVYLYEELTKNSPKLALDIMMVIFSSVYFDKMLSSPFEVALLCMFDDFVEHGTLPVGSVQAKLEQMMRHLLNRILSSTRDIGRAAAYGLGICALRLPKDFARVLGVEKTVVDLLQFLDKMQEHSATEDVKFMWDNVIGALGRILKSFPENMNQILPYYMGNMPLLYDTEENLPQYEIFTELLTRDNFPSEFRTHANMKAILNGVLKEKGCSDKAKSIAEQTLSSLN